MDPTRSSDTRSDDIHNDTRETSGGQQTGRQGQTPKQTQGQQLPPGAEWEGAQPGQGDPGMLGALGTEPLPGIPTHTSPIGVPTEVGGVASPGAVVPPGVSTADTMKQADVYATPGDMGHAYGQNVDPGTPGVGGTPVPGGPLRTDPTPPLMPDYGRAGEEGFEATLEGVGSGVATGSSPVFRRPDRGAAESSFNRYVGSPTMGVTAEDEAGEQTDRGVTDPEGIARSAERMGTGKPDGATDGAPNPDARDVVADAPEPGANM